VPTPKTNIDEGEFEIVVDTDTVPLKKAFDMADGWGWHFHSDMIIDMSIERRRAVGE
jgi:hypothetical protein